MVDRVVGEVAQREGRADRPLRPARAIRPASASASARVGTTCARAALGADRPAVERDPPAAVRLGDRDSFQNRFIRAGCATCGPASAARRTCRPGRRDQDVAGARRDSRITPRRPMNARRAPSPRRRAHGLDRHPAAAGDVFANRCVAIEQLSQMCRASAATASAPAASSSAGRVIAPGDADARGIPRRAPSRYRRRCRRSSPCRRAARPPRPSPARASPGAASRDGGRRSAG